MDKHRRVLLIQKNLHDFLLIHTAKCAFVGYKYNSYMLACLCELLKCDAQECCCGKSITSLPIE